MVRTRLTRTATEALRREVPCTVAILVGEDDFTTMRRYRTFAFTDYEHYLAHIEDLLRALRSRGMHVRAAVFDPAEFADYCAAEAMEPDAPISRARYAADSAGPGAAVHYQGESIDQLVRAVLHGAERRATWERATRALDTSQSGPAALDRVTAAVATLIERAGPGIHHLVCSASVHGVPLIAVLHAESEDGPVQVREEDALLFCAVLAAGTATDGGGGAVLRTRTGPGSRDTVRGWILRDGTLQPLNEAEVFNAYCTDHRTGEPIAPEHGVDYRSGFPLTEREGHS
ncbi:hypothetical protein [Wenjunlia tyrosinilytica]|uniref:Uncharacterized protein n=1 Tax=Wenjunlia tyrosinilytica TaxID=1544741 RepID=A0A918E1Q0_9ACTN|nr:hypothetical protein [Wenjunlia tyrosinilytica]GGO96863.1 hypothetical protein GCM10012280_57320 [Wenjunlia tyrosinilytica]